MKSPQKLLIASASPKRLNSNFNLCNYVTAAAIDYLGIDSVSFSEFEKIEDTISLFKPDICLIFGSVMPDECDFYLIKKTAERHSCKLAFWLHDDPYEIDAAEKIKSVADYIFTNDKFSSFFYNHSKVFHLPLAGSPTHHFMEISVEKKYEIFFCGVGYSNRNNLIQDLSHTLYNYNSKIIGTNWPRHLTFCENKRIPNDKLTDYYNKSLVTLNIGRHLNLANERFMLTPSTPGPRTFESALAGTIQFYFTESLEIEEYFTPDEEIILFDDVKSFNIHLTRVFEDKNYALSLARNSQQRALKDHCYIHRIRKLLSCISN